MKRKHTVAEEAVEIITGSSKDSAVLFHELNNSIKLATYQLLEIAEADPSELNEQVVGEILRQLWVKGGAAGREAE